LKRSFDFKRSSANSRLALAWVIEVPPIEPELSITNTISRGSVSFWASASSGGVTRASR